MPETDLERLEEMVAAQSARILMALEGPWRPATANDEVMGLIRLMGGRIAP